MVSVNPHNIELLLLWGDALVHLFVSRSADQHSSSEYLRYAAGITGGLITLTFSIIGKQRACTKKQ